VVDAVADGKFHIWTMKHIDDGIELVMGKPAREIHNLVKQRLRDMQENLESGE